MQTKALPEDKNIIKYTNKIVFCAEYSWQLDQKVEP